MMTETEKTETRSNPYKESKNIIQSLAAIFPQCFSEAGATKPLKRGIFQDLVLALEVEKPESAFSKVKLRRALRVYTEQWRYLHSFVEGAQRVNLLGEAIEAVTAEDIDFAKTHLAESKKRYSEWKKAREATNPELKRQNQTKQNQAKEEKPARKHKPKAAKKAEMKPKTNAENLGIVLEKVSDLAALKIGDSVYVDLGARPVKAVISEIDKQTAKVKLVTGMEMTLQAGLLSVQK